MIILNRNIDSTFILLQLSQTVLRYMPYNYDMSYVNNTWSQYYELL